MLSFSPSGTQVVLIGTAQCPLDREHLSDLPGVSANIDALEEIFGRTSEFGIPKDAIHVIKNPGTSAILLTCIADAAEQASDTLIVYYAGHGIKSFTADGLFIATSETREKHCHLTGVDFQDIRLTIYNSKAKKKILIFDCCYSGEILGKQMGGAGDSVLKNAIDISGAYSIASAPKHKAAIAPLGEKFTAFTRELINVLKDGINNDSEYITLDALFEQIKSRLISHPDLPAPQRAASGDLGSFKLAKNTFFENDPLRKLARLESFYKCKLDEVSTLLTNREEEIVRLNNDKNSLREKLYLIDKNWEIKSASKAGAKSRLSFRRACLLVAAIGFYILAIVAFNQKNGEAVGSYCIILASVLLYISLVNKKK